METAVRNTLGDDRQDGASTLATPSNRLALELAEEGAEFVGRLAQAPGDGPTRSGLVLAAVAAVGIGALWFTGFRPGQAMVRRITQDVKSWIRFGER